MKNGIGPKTMVLGLIVGTLSIPALVFAATSVVGPGDDGVAEATTTTTSTTVATVESTPTTSSTTTTIDSDAALSEACGEDGLDLVAAETDGSITELEQAALDALRPLCDEAGLSLPAPAAPESVVIVQTVEAAAPVATAASAAGTQQFDDDDHHEDDEYEDEDHDDEHEDEHGEDHHEDEHEDEDD